MLVLNARQMAVLDAYSLEQFAKRLARFIRRNCEGPFPWNPNLRLPLEDEHLLELLRAQLARAGSYGMQSEASLAAYASLAFTFAPDFDQLPIPRAILMSEEIPPEKRIFKIFEMIVDSETVRNFR